MMLKKKNEYGIEMCGRPLDGETLKVIPFNMLDDLQDEYFSIPRGRVVYHTDTQKFYVYHENNVPKVRFAKSCEIILPAERKHEL